MAIAANKFPRVRAAACVDEVTAELSRRHNDVNVLCLSGDLLSSRSTERLVDIWMSTEFEGGRHQRRLDKILELEQEKHGGS
jgi:ribose 5-phosphate isomerase B